LEGATAKNRLNKRSEENMKLATCKPDAGGPLFPTMHTMPRQPA